MASRDHLLSTIQETVTFYEKEHIGYKQITSKGNICDISTTVIMLQIMLLTSNRYIVLLAVLVSPLHFINFNLKYVASDLSGNTMYMVVEAYKNNNLKVWNLSLFSVRYAGLISVKQCRHARLMNWGCGKYLKG